MDGVPRSASAIDWAEFTSAQMPVWLDLQSGTDPRFYIIGGYLRIFGAINPAIFHCAVALAMARNDALRLRFHADEPKQSCHPGRAPPIAFLDLSDADDPEAAFLDFIDTEFTRLFDAERGPLFHFTLAKGREQHWFLLIRYHHLIVDGLGISLMIRAVADAYRAIMAADAETEIAALSYSRFIAEDAEYRTSARRARDVEYWVERFRELPPPLFPARSSAGAVEAYTPARSVKSWVEWPHYQRFLDRCRERDTTPFPVLTALLGALLSRTLGSRDITIGVPILNRPTAEFKRMIGMFAGMMPLRLEVDPAASVKELVAHVAEQLRRGYRHQRAPIPEVQHALGLTRLGRRQLFDVALSYEKNDYDFPIGEAPFQLIGLTGGYELNPLALYVREYHREKPVLLEFAFNTRHLTRAEVDDLACRFRALLDAYIADDAAPVAALSLLSSEERAAMVEGWNATDVALPEATLAGLFAAAAARHGAAVAVVCGAERLTYAELEARSSRLARRLVALGVGADRVVGVALERSLDLVVTLLAVVKAGGAFLPLERSLPPARLA
ncbi:MAG TPA: condensation domain-containing protein, partial [Stellaceae bacterium]|nr:condensation domain-containing protein [Stellaceae bacterium]